LSRWFWDVADIVIGLVIIALATLIALWLARRLIGRLVEPAMRVGLDADPADELAAAELSKRRATVEALAIAVVRVIIVIVAAVAALVVVFPAIDFAPVIAALGVVGAGLAIALRDVIGDYLAGVFILAENQYARGDVVEIAGVQGTVEDFGLRRTVLRDLNGTVHTVSNGEIRVASNMTRVWNRVNLDLTLGYGTDIDRVTAVVDEVGRQMAGDPAWSGGILEAPHVARVEALVETGVTLKVLGTVRPADRWALAGELRKRILAAFEQNGILLAAAQQQYAAPGPTSPPAAARGGAGRARSPSRKEPRSATEGPEEE
jgi:small-conductance mechanosensitive channel